MDVLTIMQKKRQPIEGLEVAVDGKRSDEQPHVYTDIQICYYVRGNVSPTSVARSIELSVNKYCPVTAMLRPTAKITTRFELLGEASAEESLLENTQNPM
jgi:putative redox protein